jgi:hypothetical protein
MRQIYPTQQCHHPRPALRQDEILQWFFDRQTQLPLNIQDPLGIIRRNIFHFSFADRVGGDI